LARSRVVLGLCAWFLVTSPAAADPAFPKIVTDGFGRSVAIERKPQRIVSIFASNTEMLAAIGIADRIVGIEDYTRYPAGIDSRARVGGRLGFSIEAVAKLDPDLVVMTPARNAVSNLLKPLEMLGIPTVIIVHRDIRQVFGNIALLGEATGEGDAARALLSAMRMRIDAVAAEIADRPKRSVYLETSAAARGNFMTAQTNSYTADILRLSGGQNVFDGIAGQQVSGEAVLLADPETVLLASTGVTPQKLGTRAGWDRLNAVQSGNVFSVSRAFLLIPGPRVVDGIESVARLLHPDAFR